MGTVCLNLDRHEVAALGRALSAHLERCDCSRGGAEARCDECRLIAPILADAQRLDRRPRHPATFGSPSNGDRRFHDRPSTVVPLFPGGSRLSGEVDWDATGHR